MATYTENYDLVKPEESDYYNVENFNENMDTIDSVMAAAEQAVEGINEKIGTSSEGNTLFSLLENNTKNGLTAIKSIQHLIFNCTNGQTSTTITLDNAVTPANCVALWERLYGTGHVENYTINTSTLSITHGTAMGNSYIFGCWIIEFM